MTDLHRTLKRQLRAASQGDGELDVARLLELVSRSYKEQEDDNRRTDHSIRLMIDEVEQSNASLASTRDLLLATLDAIRHGIIMVSVAGQVQICNRRACEILGLPDVSGSGTTTLSDLIEKCGAYAVEPGDMADSAILTTSDGRTVELHVEPMPHFGKVILVEDISDERAREQALRQAESEYRSLFENSVYGIYRDTLDGKPVRANPALVALNGFTTETEQLQAASARQIAWYVDHDRDAQFRQILERDGRVHDLVSEAYRLATGEKFWIAENAWYVRDAAGAPIFIEGTIQDATERITAQKAMRNLIECDQLTGAASRYHFMQTLSAAVANGERPFALCGVDLDMFKDINDGCGHAAGDHVLKVVTRRLQALTRNDDIVGRLGGDEFAVICFAAEVVADPALLAREIVRSMRTAITLDGVDYKIGASVGVALYPSHGTDAEELLKRADIALYEAKAAGRGRWRMFDHELRAGLEDRKQIEAGLRAAIARDELDFHFQPVVHADDGHPVSFEALLRFSHPVLGPIPPSRFIPIAEQAGMMSELGMWAISRAIDSAAALGDAKIHVNVSATQFRTPGLLSHVKQQLERTGLEPERLVLEITESVLMSNEAVARDVITSLHKLGVGIALDDFGTGYSSLSYLSRLPISMVKLDRAFVAALAHDTGGLAVIRAVLGIGRELGIEVVVVGVETEAQRAILIAEGCRLMQGFLFARPKPVADAAADLALKKLTDPKGPQHASPGRALVKVPA